MFYMPNPMLGTGDTSVRTELPGLTKFTGERDN